jgi:hypothetical protein
MAGLSKLLRAFVGDCFRSREQLKAENAVLRQRLRVMGIRDRPIAPRSPWQNRYVERAAGSIRRECLDHMIVRSEAHLRWILNRYVAYYNVTRGHLGLR